MKWLLRVAVLCACMGMVAGVQADAHSAAVEYGKELRKAREQYNKIQQEYVRQQRVRQAEFAQQFNELQEKYQADRQQLSKEYRAQQVTFKKESVKLSRQQQADQRTRKAEYVKALKAAEESLAKASRAYQASQRKISLDYSKKRQQAQRELSEADRADYQKAQQKYNTALQNYDTERAELLKKAENAYYQEQASSEGKRAELEEKFAAESAAAEQQRWDRRADLEQRHEDAQLQYEQTLQKLEEQFVQQQEKLELEHERWQADNENRFAESRSTYRQAMRKAEEQQEMIAQGQARTAELGIYLAPQSDGAIVIDRVVRRSAAEEAGLKRDDILLAINNTKLPHKEKSGAALRIALDTLGQVEVGEVVELDLKRADKKLNKAITVRLPKFTSHGETRQIYQRIANDLSTAPVHLDGTTFLQTLVQTTGSHVIEARLEMTVLNKQLGSYFGVDDGVLVANVAKDNVYQLQPGDVIVSIGGRSVGTPNKVTRLLSTYEPGEQVNMDIVRNKERKALKVQLPEQ